jgi:hypothetical protein
MHISWSLIVRSPATFNKRGEATLGAARRPAQVRAASPHDEPHRREPRSRRRFRIRDPRTTIGPAAPAQPSPATCPSTTTPADSPPNRIASIGRSKGFSFLKRITLPFSRCSARFSSEQDPPQACRGRSLWREVYSVHKLANHAVASRSADTLLRCFREARRAMFPIAFYDLFPAWVVRARTAARDRRPLRFRFGGFRANRTQPLRQWLVEHGWFNVRFLTPVFPAFVIAGVFVFAFFLNTFPAAIWLPETIEPGRERGFLAVRPPARAQAARMNAPAILSPRRLGRRGGGRG